MNSTSYEAAASASGMPVQRSRIATPALTKEERREETFWRCRRSLRLWPIRDNSRSTLDDYLQDKLGLDADFIQEVGRVKMRLNKDPRAKIKNEAIILFENKDVRDAVRARASYLANHRDTAGMRLEIPDH